MTGRRTLDFTPEEESWIQKTVDKLPPPSPAQIAAVKRVFGPIHTWPGYKDAVARAEEADCAEEDETPRRDSTGAHILPTLGSEGE